MSKKTKKLEEEEVTEVDEEAIALEDVITKTEELPKATRRRSPIYDRVLEHIVNSAKGTYKIDIHWKETKTVYQTFAKKIRDNPEYKKTLKLRISGENLYIQKLE